MYDFSILKVMTVCINVNASFCDTFSSSRSVGSGVDGCGYMYKRFKDGGRAYKNTGSSHLKTKKTGLLRPYVFWNTQAKVNSEHYC